MGADLFSIGRSGLTVSKKSLETTSHNIANANNEGFTRQRITHETNTPIAEGSDVRGTGVNVQGIKRVHDELVEKKLNHAISGHGFNEERSFQLSKVEEIFNEVNSEGLNKILNRFFNSFRELSNQPENESVRNIVRENARIVIRDFQRVREALHTVEQSIDNKLEDSVIDINSMAEKIAALNVEIARLEVGSGEANDLRDQRDMAIKSLSEYFKVKTYQDEKGQFVVNIDGAGSLVAGNIVSRLKVGKVLPEGFSNEERAKAEIFFETRGDNPISAKLAKGKLGGALLSRNHEIDNLKKQMDHLAYGLSKATNAIHRRGFKNIRYPTDPQGNAILAPSLGKITGINFFKEPTSEHRAAEYLELSDDVKADLNNIATGLEPNKPGDNRIAIAISKLQHEKVLEDGTTTFEEQYLKSVGNIGLSTSKAKIDTEQSQGILAQARSIRERVSGVSLDEETANLVKYQHAYEASAKVIKTADEMFTTVLGMMNR